MTKVRCKVGERVFPPMEVAELRKVPGFTLQTLVAPESCDEWKPAYLSINLAAYFAPSKPVVREPIDPGLWERVNEMDEMPEMDKIEMVKDISVPEPVVRQSLSTVNHRPIELPTEFPLESPKKFNWTLFVAMSLIAGTVYGGIAILMPRLGLPMPWVHDTVLKVTIAPVPPTSTPAPALLDKPAAAAPAVMVRPPAPKPAAHKKHRLTPYSKRHSKIKKHPHPKVTP
jgi:hypothetical protein